MAKKPPNRWNSRMLLQHLTLEHHDTSATLTINRPEKLNSLSSEVLRELHQAFSQLDAEGQTRAVVLTGSGDRAFAAGADVEEMSGMSVAEARDYSGLGHRLAHCMEGSRFPIIAAVSGFALGGGCELALCADFILAADNAVFGMPEVTLGLMPGFGGTLRLASRIGVARARQLIYQGRKLKAKEALQLGLANEVVAKEELLPRAKEVAAQIAGNAPLAVQAAKRAILLGQNLESHSASEFEADAFAKLFSSEDAQEGVRAFLAKERSVQFKGR
jgi:enoyl-CoA hydratase